MTNNQSNELRDMLLEAMGDFPTDHILQYHIDKFEAYCKERERQARIQAIDDVKKAGYGYDDGTGFVLKISYKELAQLIGDK